MSLNKQLLVDDLNRDILKKSNAKNKAINPFTRITLKRELAILFKLRNKIFRGFYDQA